MLRTIRSGTGSVVATQVDLPLSTLAAGDDLLSISVTLDKTKVARTARFSVR